MAAVDEAEGVFDPVPVGWGSEALVLFGPAIVMRMTAFVSFRSISSRNGDLCRIVTGDWPDPVLTSSTGPSAIIQTRSSHLMASVDHGVRKKRREEKEF